MVKRKKSKINKVENGDPQIENFSDYDIEGNKTKKETEMPKLDD